MNLIARGAAAGAAVIAIALIGVNFASSRKEIAAVPSVIPTLTTSATPDGSPTLVQGEVSLHPGRYLMAGMGAKGKGFALVITVPAGWSSLEDFAVTKNYAAEAGAGLGVWPINNRYVNACTDHTLLDPPPGPSIDDLIESMSSQPGVKAGSPTELTIDGYHGKSFDLTVTTDIETCGGPEAFWLWGSPGDPRFVQGNEELNRIYVLDVAGARQTFFARIPTITTATDRAELEAIIASIEIQPG